MEKTNAVQTFWHAALHATLLSLWSKPCTNYYWGRLYEFGSTLHWKYTTQIMHNQAKMVRAWLALFLGTPYSHGKKMRYCKFWQERRGCAHHLCRFSGPIKMMRTITRGSCFLIKEKSHSHMQFSKILIYQEDGSMRIFIIKFEGSTWPDVPHRWIGLSKLNHGFNLLGWSQSRQVRGMGHALFGSFALEYKIFWDFSEAHLVLKKRFLPEKHFMW